jgi:Protein of unknown function (DUF2800)
MNAPAPFSHSRIGGSSAYRARYCPASVSLIERVPPELRSLESTYSREGTAMHVAIAELIEGTVKVRDLPGREINGHRLTEDNVNLSLIPALMAVEPLLDGPGALYHLEQRLEFPNAAGAFGTADLLIRIRDDIYVIDFKFGQGITVSASYVRDGVTVPNDQGMFYAVAGRHSLPKFFKGSKRIILMFVQPQTADLDAPITSTFEVTRTDLDVFEINFTHVCREAMSPSPRARAGAHCAFCAAKGLCPEHSKEVIEAAALPVSKPPSPTCAIFSSPEQAQLARDQYGQLLASLLEARDALRPLWKAAEDQARAFLDLGYAVPGFCLSEGRASRKWRDNDADTTAALMQLGLIPDQIFEKAMRTPAAMEKYAKTRGLKIPQELIVTGHSGTALKRIENAPHPALGTGEAVRLFAEALRPYKDKEI